MNLLDLARGAAKIPPNHSILIYGPPKMGKTRLAGTAARIPEVKKIWWFDGENGAETLINMSLTDEELSKITLFKMRDTKNEPLFIETVLKAFTSKTPVNICDGHGRIDCAECKKNGIPSVQFFLPACKHDELVITDSGSQLGDSAMAALTLGKESMYKPGWDEYGIQGKWLSDVLSVIQACVHTNMIMLTHEICVEDDEKKDKFFPLVGTKAFSMKCAKYFGTVVYVHKKLNKHTGGSSSTYLGDRLTGSRINAHVESEKELDMKTILIKGGVFRDIIGIQKTDSEELPVTSIVEIERKEPKSEPVTNKLAQLLANKRK